MKADREMREWLLSVLGWFDRHPDRETFTPTDVPASKGTT
jgi:hypothetical protein